MRSVTIIGAGPAGLSAARALRTAGIDDVLVLERNPEAGGLPRFAGHLGFGMLDFHRLWTGPAYARRLVEAAAGVEIRLNHAVTALHPGGEIEVNGPQGSARIASRVVLLATGIREKPRSARLIAGTRPWGVTSTGAFQEMVYRGGMLPFRHPVVVGTELVSFSNLMTARHAGIRPVAMIEAGDRITARRPGDWVARAVLGVAVRLRTRLLAIEGTERVSGVRVLHDGVEETIPCDGVILSGDFVPETALLRAGHIAIDPGTGGPSIDEAWRCSDPAYLAAGNLLRPVEHAGAAALEGRAAAAAVLRALRGGAVAPAPAVAVQAGAGLRYVYPQRLAGGAGPVRLFARAAAAHDGRLRVVAGGQTLLDRRQRILPERRLTIDLPEAARRPGQDLRVELV